MFKKHDALKIMADECDPDDYDDYYDQEVEAPKKYHGDDDGYYGEEVPKVQKKQKKKAAKGKRRYRKNDSKQ